MPTSISDNLLTEKVNALAWLVRCHTFIADIQKADMITAFKNSEIISTRHGKKMPFQASITKS